MQNEQNTEKETFLVPSMDGRYMDGIKKEYRKPDTPARITCKKGRSIYRLAAAGLAGTLLTANVSAADCPMRKAGADPESGYALRSFSPDDCGWSFEGRDPESIDHGPAEYDSSAAYDDWDEEKILETWDLDPDDFPAEQQESTPYIPDDLVPYFEEATAEAGAWYAGDTPPVSNLYKYSARADAIRKAAGEKAEKALRGEYRRILSICRALTRSTQEAAGRDLVYSLQNGHFCRGTDNYALAFSSSASGQYAAEYGDGNHTAPFVGPVMVPGISTKGSTENRANGFSSIDLFLNRQNSSGEDASSEDNSSGEDVFPDKEKTGENGPSAGSGTSAGNTGSSVSNAFFEPAGGFLLTAPFLYDIDPLTNMSMRANIMPAPAGIYPRAGSGSGYVDPDEKQDDKQDHSLSANSESLASDDVRNSPNSGKSDVYRDPYGESRIPYRYPLNNSSDPYSYSEHRKTVFIGDSRTVGMEIYCGGEPDEYWFAENSMGYSWMVDSGVPSAEPFIDQYTDVVILMGVNDLGNVYKYVDYMNAKAAEWKVLGARTFFVSVTPVDDRKSKYAKNARIESFNEYAVENLQDVYYIDAYSRIRNSFGSPDGIHFDRATYCEIYRIISFYLYRGWYEKDGLWFYFDHGNPVTGWQYLDGQWQYMDGYGVRWIRNGRVGDLCLVPLPDFHMTGRETDSPSF